MITLNQNGIKFLRGGDYTDIHVIIYRIWPFMLPSIGGILAIVYLDIHVTVYSGINDNICLGIHAKVTTITC